MTNKNYVNGANYERKIKKQYEARGWTCFRTAGSHSVVDLICFDTTRGIIRFIQCKRGKLTPKQIEKIFDNMNHLSMIGVKTEIFLHSPYTIELDD